MSVIPDPFRVWVNALHNFENHKQKNPLERVWGLGHVQKQYLRLSFVGPCTKTVCIPYRQHFDMFWDLVVATLRQRRAQAFDMLVSGLRNVSPERPVEPIALWWWPNKTHNS